MNERNQMNPVVAEIPTDLLARLGALDRQRVDPGDRIRAGERAVLVATKALHAAKSRLANLLEQKGVHEHAAAEARATVDRLTVRENELSRVSLSEAVNAELREIELAKWLAVREAEEQGRAALQLDSLIVSAGENQRACDVHRRQALLDVAHLRLHLEATRYQEFIAHTIPEVFQAFVDEAERFAQVYKATQGRPVVGFDAVAVALRALNVQMNVMAGERAPILAQSVPAANEASSVVTAVEELKKGI